LANVQKFITIITRLIVRNSKAVVVLKVVVEGILAVEVEEAKENILFIKEEEKMLFVEEQEKTTVMEAKVILIAKAATIIKVVVGVVLLVVAKVIMVIEEVK
jgi:putative heme iron utilization protein